jgi:hypothetical protein
VAEGSSSSDNAPEHSRDRTPHITVDLTSPVLVKRFVGDVSERWLEPEGPIDPGVR